MVVGGVASASAGPAELYLLGGSGDPHRCSWALSLRNLLREVLQALRSPTLLWVMLGGW